MCRAAETARWLATTWPPADDHDSVHIALDRHHLKRERPRDAVPIVLESDGLIFVHRSRGTDHAGIETVVGKRGRGGLFLGEPRSDHERAEERLNGSLRSASQRCRKYCVQLIEVCAPRDGGGEAALHGPDGALGVGLFVAASRHAEKRLEDVVAGQRGVSGMELSFPPEQDQGGDCFGVVPPDFLRDGLEELEGCDHAFEDRLGALEWQSQNEGIIRVGPGGNQERNKPAAVGEIDMDMAEIGFEALARKMAQRDECFPLRRRCLRT